MATVGHNPDMRTMMPNAMNHVVLSKAEHERRKEELNRLLDEGLADKAAGNYRPAADVFRDIEEKYGFREV